MNTYKIPYNEEPIGCPKCENSNISMVDHEYEIGTIIRKYRCDYCGFQWAETYEFREWEEIPD